MKANPTRALIFSLVGVLVYPAARGADESQGLEEVVVTAERRAQSLQELPAAASALTGEALKAQQVLRIDDLVRTTPSLAINDTGLGKFVNIRGIGKGADLPGIAAGVAYYVDGVPVPNQIFLETPFADLSRVEILRGPQGTLVGMNSTGGAVLIVSQDPQYGAFNGFIEQTLGNDSYSRTQGIANLGISEKWGVRAVGEYEKRDSFFESLGPASGTPGDLDRLSFRGSLAGELTETAKLYLRAEYNRTKNDGPASKPISGDPDPMYAVINQFSPVAAFALARDVVTAKDTKYGRVSAELRIDVGNLLEFRSITGYQKGEVTYITDLDAASLPTIRNSIDIEEPVVSQEFNFISLPGGAFDWVVGAFYLWQNTDGDIVLNQAISGAEQVHVVGRGRTRNLGIFGQGTFHWTDRLNATLGLRYNNERHYSGSEGRTILNGGAVVLPNGTAEADDSAVTGRFTLDYQLGDSHFIYGTISRGFKGGGVNDAGPTFEPETVWNYEAGLKSSFLDNHLETQVALFFDQLDGIQYERYNPVTTLTSVDNVGKADVYGFELQGQSQFGGLRLNGVIAYTKSELDATSLVDPRYHSDASIDLTGRSLTFSPAWSFSAGIEYAIALGKDFNLTPRVQYSYLDSQWASFYQVRPTDFIEDRRLLDASLSLSQPEGWRFELYGTNLADETYIVSKAVAAAGRPGRVQYYGAPRQYGIRVGYQF